MPTIQKADRRHKRDLFGGRASCHGIRCDARVAEAFDLAGIENTVGAPSFALFAKGGYHKAGSSAAYAT
jgi:hypothetical protein